MVRAFRPDPVAATDLHAVLEAAACAPSAGNSRAVGVVVLDRRADVARYWDVALPPERRARFRFPGLLVAPVLLVVTTDPDAYVGRYSEPDKALTGLGVSRDAWPVPYWFADAGGAVMAMLMAVVDRGLGACYFGAFEREPALKSAFAIPESRRIVGTIALGHSVTDPEGRSAARGRSSPEDLAHVGRWGRAYRASPMAPGPTDNVAADRTSPSPSEDHDMATKKAAPAKKAPAKKAPAKKAPAKKAAARKAVAAAKAAPVKKAAPKKVVAKKAAPVKKAEPKKVVAKKAAPAKKAVAKKAAPKAVAAAKAAPVKAAAKKVVAKKAAPAKKAAAKKVVAKKAAPAKKAVAKKAAPAKKAVAKKAAPKKATASRAGKK